MNPHVKHEVSKAMIIMSSYEMRNVSYVLNAFHYMMNDVNDIVNIPVWA